MNLARMSALLLWTTLWAGCLLSGSPALGESVWLGGKAYARLNDWARGNAFDMRWTQRDETLVLSNERDRIRLQIHSPEAQVNGVQVRLLFPLVLRQDTVYISELDIRQTLRPVLWPPRGSSSMAVKTICLDPGHGGRDPGFQIGKRNEEKKYTLLVAQELKEQFKRAGFKVAMTRNRDTSVERAARTDLARQSRADLFISVHFNATVTSATTVQGAEVYCLTPAGAPSTNSGGERGPTGWCEGNRFNDYNMFLAYQVQKGLTRAAGMEDRGVHRARFEVLRDATMPAILIEAGFMSHPAESGKIRTATYRRELARGIVEGVMAYKRTVERG